MSDQYSAFDPRYYFFAGRKPDDPLSYEGLQTRRKIAEAIMSKRSPYPKTFGEGLTALGEGLGDRMTLNALDKAEREAEAGQSGFIKQLLAGQPAPSGAEAGTGMPMATPATVSAAASEPMDEGPNYVPPAITSAGIPMPRPRPQEVAGLPMPERVPRIPGRSDTIPSQTLVQVPNDPDIEPGVWPPQPRMPQTPMRVASAAGPPWLRGAGIDYTRLPPQWPEPQALGPLVPQPVIRAAPEPAPASEVPPTTGPAGSLPTTIEKAPASLPSQERIPPPSPPYKTEVRPMPVRPAPLGLSQKEIDLGLLQVEAARRFGPHSPSVALIQQRLDLAKAQRAELEKQQQEEYAHQRGLSEADRKLEEQRRFEEPARILKEHIDRVGVEKAQADLEKAYYERGLPREQAATKAELDIAEVRRKVGEPHRVNLEGTEYSAQYNPATGTYGPLSVSPGAPKPEVKPFTQEQANATAFVGDVLPDISSPNNLKYGMVLANSPGSSAGSTLGGLIGLGNVPITKEYRAAQLHFGRFSGAVMKFLSGAAVTPSEAERNLPAFIPRYGDTENDVREKIARQVNYVNTVQRTAGTAGENAIEKGRQLIMQANGELPPVPYDPRSNAEKPAPGRRVILPDGTEGRQPWPKELLPK